MQYILLSSHIASFRATVSSVTASSSGCPCGCRLMACRWGWMPPVPTQWAYREPAYSKCHKAALCVVSRVWTLLLIHSVGCLIFPNPFFSAWSVHPDDLPKPQITVQPENTVTVLGSDVRLTCTAASSSSSPVTFAWRKDQELLRHGEMENFAHVRTHHQGSAPDTSGVMEYTTILHLRRATFAHEGRYQCIITNHFGSTYSNKAQVVVNGMSLFPRKILQEWSHRLAENF